MIKKYLTIAIPLAAIIAMGNTYAHHSISTQYDHNSLHVIEGTVHKFNMRSPHSSIEVDVVNDTGDTERWIVETHAVPLLRRLGVDRNNTFKPGDKIEVRGPRGRNSNKNFLYGGQVVLADGKVLTLAKSAKLNEIYGDGGGDRPKPNDNEEQKIAASAANAMSGSIIDRFQGKWQPFSGAIGKNKKHGDPSPLPLNEAGIAAREAYDPLDTPAMRCHPLSLPGLVHTPFIYDIKINGEEITFFHEYQDVTRKVSLGAENVAEPRFMGYANAKLEGEALVIEHTGFEAHPVGLGSDWDANGRGKDIPSSEQKRFVERYTVQEGGKKLVLDYTLEDPAYMSKPYELQIVWKRIPDDAQIYEFGCDVEAATKSTLLFAPASEEE